MSNLSFKRLKRYTYILRKEICKVYFFFVLLDNTFADHTLNLFYFSLQVTDKPVVVGFGISKPEHVKQVGEVTISHHLV